MSFPIALGCRRSQITEQHNIQVIELAGKKEKFNIVTHSDVNLFARNTFIAAPKSSLDKASSSGNSDDWLPTSAQTPPIMRRPTSGIGSTREAHRSLDLQGPRSSRIEAG